MRGVRCAMYLPHAMARVAHTAVPDPLRRLLHPHLNNARADRGWPAGQHARMQACKQHPGLQVGHSATAESFSAFGRVCCTGVTGD